MITRKVKIDGAEHEFGYSLRAAFIWEMAMGRRFELHTLQDTYMLYFCCFLNVDPDFMGGDFNHFIDCVDADPELSKTLGDVFAAVTAAERMLDNRKPEPKNSKKKA